MKQKITIVVGGIILLIIGIYLYLQNTPKEEVIEDTFENKQEEVEIKEEKMPIIIHIVGEINNPGIIKLIEGDRVVDAIEKAGGTTQNANLNQINLAQTVVDGEQIVIPNKEEIMQQIQNNQNKKININTANLEELKKLAGIGDSLANRILQYRKEKGNFKKIEDLKNVSGIGESKFAQIREFICI